MTYWQVFAERCPHTWDSNGLTLTSRVISICAHCRPFNTFKQAANDILAWDYPGHSAYVVEAPSSLEANRLAGPCSSRESMCPRFISSVRSALCRSGSAAGGGRRHAGEHGLAVVLTGPSRWMRSARGCCDAA